MARRSRSQNGGASGKTLFIAVPLLIVALVLLLSLSRCASDNFARNAVGGNESHTGLYISEVMSDNDSALPDENGKFGDWIELWNSTDHSMDLSYVGLSNRPDRIIFFFPQYILGPDERVIVFCDKSNQNSYDSSDPGNRKNTFHAKFGLSSIGCTVFLFDSNGRELDRMTTGTINTDESQILTGFSENGQKSYEVTEYFSPGYPNTQEGYIAYKSRFSVSVGDIVINEIMPVPRSGVTDGDGELSDWIELRNLTDKDIALKNFTLSDNEAKPYKWKFPDNAVIPANGYYLVFCSGKNKIDEATYFPHTNFSLSAEKETLVLYTIYGEMIDWVSYENIGKDVSYGRDPDTLEWRIYHLATPTQPNDAGGERIADEYLRRINTTGVYISEVMTSADTVIAINGEKASDYVEIINTTENPVDMSGWGLSDNINWPRKWQFPQGTTIWPDEHKIVLLDKSASAGNDASRLHASFSLSHSGGEIMTLSDTDGRVLDRMYIPAIPVDVSYGRTRGEGGFFYYDQPTPGHENGIGFHGYTAAPSFTVAGGLYLGSITVGVNVPENTTVRYTTDGSIPTVENGTVYTGPVEVSTTAVFRIRAFSSGLQPSETVTASYIMNTYHTLRVVSLVIEPDELWNENTGMLVDGPEAVKITGKLPFKDTIYREYGKIARPAYVEIFEQGENNTAVISQGIKIALQGDYSLDMPQKSMKVRAQASTGSRYFEYPLFSSRPYTEYKSFVLRNSGNDCVWTRLIDGFQSALVEKYIQTDIITLAFEPCIVYINGIYWGHYNMRERKDKYCICQHEGISEELADQITIIKKNYTVVQGSAEEYKTMVGKLKYSSPNTNPADRAYLDENIDIDSFLDWFAIKMYFGDSDPGNVMYYKLPVEGSKWKCLLYDLDYGMFISSFDSPASYMKEKGMGERQIVNTVFLKILEVDEYFDLFCTKIGNIYKNLSIENMNSMLTEMAAVIEPEMSLHFKRWSLDKGWKLVNSDTPSMADGMFQYWESRITRTRNVIRKRPYYIYTLFQKQFKLKDSQMEHYFGGPCPEKPAD